MIPRESHRAHTTLTVNKPPKVAFSSCNSISNNLEIFHYIVFSVKKNENIA